MNKHDVKKRCDKDGWILFETHKPKEFSLVIVQNQVHEEQLGWWTGYTWDYGRKKIKGDPYRWKILPRGFDFS